MKRARTKKILIGVMIMVFLAGGIVAINSTYEGYRVNHATDMDIDEWGTCNNVLNTGNDLFVPTKTSAEWSTFRTHLPSGVSLGACAECVDEIDCINNYVLCPYDLYCQFDGTCCASGYNIKCPPQCILE